MTLNFLIRSNDFSPFPILGVGLLCQVKWAEMKLVVYVMAPGVFYMGLYQVSFVISIIIVTVVYLLYVCSNYFETKSPTK